MQYFLYAKRCANFTDRGPVGSSVTLPIFSMPF